MVPIHQPSCSSQPVGQLLFVWIRLWNELLRVIKYIQMVLKCHNILSRWPETVEEHFDKDMVHEIQKD